MVQSVVLASDVKLPIGVTTSKTVTIPAIALARTISITIDASNFVQGITCEFAIQLYLNGAWQPLMSANFGPNVCIGLDGNPLTTWAMAITPYQLTIPDCQVRGVATIGGSPFETTITATVT